jgi:F-type H+-transporting ATPase subunit delta
MTARLEGYAAAVLGMAPDTRAVERAAGAAAVEHLIVNHPRLSAAMTDTAVPAAARRALLDDLLQGRVDDEVRRVVRFAAGSVAGPAVPAALAWIAHYAHHVADGQDVVPGPLGHLASRDRVGGFATALCEESVPEQLDEIEDELFRFARTVETAPALRGALTDRDLPAKVRRGVVEDLVVGKVQPATARMVDYAVAAGRPRDLVGTLHWLVEHVADVRGWRVALVASAREMGSQEREQLVASLDRLTGRPVELQVVVEPSLLAGVRVRIGDLQVDATARGRLDLLEDHIAAAGWADRGFGGGRTRLSDAGEAAQGAGRADGSVSGRGAQEPEGES